MESFATYFKRHGLMLWVTNLLGYMAISTAIFFVGVIIFLIALLTGVLTFMSVDFSSIDFLSSDYFDQLFSKLQKASIGIFGIILLVLLFIGFMLFAGSFQVAGQYASANEIFQANRVNIGTYFTKGIKYTFRLLLIMIVNALLYLPIMVFAGFAIFLLLPMSDTVQTIIAIIIGIIIFTLAFLLGLAMLHSPFILIAENTGVIRSIILSIRLFSQSFGHVFTTCLLIWGVSLSYIFVGFILNVPLFFSLFDPSGILAIIVSLIVNILQWLYSLFGWPFMLAMIGLVIAYRYHKYLRPKIFPQRVADGENQEPIFTFK